MKYAVLIAMLFANVAAAQDVVVQRVVLPLDGSPVDLGAYASDGPLHVVLYGTVSFKPTATEHDLSGTFAGGSLRDTHSLIALPPNARILSGDLRSHRYEIEIPAGEPAPIHFRATELATEHLMVASELGRSLDGAITIDVMGPAPVVLAQMPKAQARAARHAILIAGGVLLALLALGFGFARVHRREDRRLMRRATRARRAVDREVIVLGPAFHHVARFAERLADTARTTRAHYLDAIAAHERAIRVRGDQAAKPLIELIATRDAALDQLRGIVEKLELTAAELASHHATQSRDLRAEALMIELESELDAAREADDEARMIG